MAKLHSIFQECTGIEIIVHHLCLKDFKFIWINLNLQKKQNTLLYRKSLYSIHRVLQKYFQELVMEAHWSRSDYKFKRKHWQDQLSALKQHWNRDRLRMGAWRCNSGVLWKAGSALCPKPKSKFFLAVTKPPPLLEGKSMNEKWQLMF